MALIKLHVKNIKNNKDKNSQQEYTTAKGYLFNCTLKTHLKGTLLYLHLFFFSACS